VQLDSEQPCMSRHRSASGGTPAVELEDIARVGWLEFFLHKGYINKQHTIIWEANPGAHLSSFAYNHLISLCGTVVEDAAATPSSSARIGLGVGTTSASATSASNVDIDRSRVAGSPRNGGIRVRALPATPSARECLQEATSGSRGGQRCRGCLPPTSSGVEDDAASKGIRIPRGIAGAPSVNIARPRTREASPGSGFGGDGRFNNTEGTVLYID
jgi:hypothetical protein